MRRSLKNQEPKRIINNWLITYNGYSNPIYIQRDNGETRETIYTFQPNEYLSARCALSALSSMEEFHLPLTSKFITLVCDYIKVNLKNEGGER